MQWSDFNDKTIGRFREFQQLSFEVQTAVASELTTGVTERAVARQLMKAYREAGVASFFHLPVVLFGDRTALPDPWDILQFWPTERELAPGDAVILDASPIFDGLLVDTSSSLCHGISDPAIAGSTGYEAAAADDLAYRASILDAVKAGASFADIAIAVDRQLASSGYRNCHRLHPGEVLGHRVGEVGDASEPDDRGFANDLVTWFYDQLAPSNHSVEPPPTWSANPGSQHAPADRLWAVEPHLGIGDVGVKWEEILVIQGDEVFWLDDNPPHVDAEA